jgi:probable F420-dependent oxidoreductase
VRFIAMYPECPDPDTSFLEAGSVTELAQAAEAAGIDGLGFTEHPAPSASWLHSGGHQSLDPFVALAAAGAVTERLALLTFLSVVPYRNPLLLAKTAASVDLVSNGRFILGAGAGYLKSEYFALGVDFDERNALFDEALEVMALHWSGEPFSFQGRHFSAREVLARPRPTKSPLPVWIGGNSDAALRRAARHATGWMPMMGSAQLAQTARTRVIDSDDALAERLGRLKEYAGDRFDSMELIVSYQGRGLDEFEADVERHREGFAQLAELGVTWVVISPPWAPAPAASDWLHRFGATFLHS